GQEPATLLAELVRVVSDTAVSITPQGPSWPATESPTDTELFQAIVAAARARDPKALVTTPPLTGFTDSHYFRRLGIVSYGRSPFLLNVAACRGALGGARAGSRGPGRGPRQPSAAGARRVGRVARALHRTRRRGRGARQP